MQRLSALDASFLYGEAPETPMHIAGLAVMEPAPQGTSPFEAFREHIRERLHLLPFFQRKLATAPLQLDHPVWVDDDALDLDYHIRHMALPQPGSREQLMTLVSRLHMILLDRGRPLWQYYIIEGLEEGRFAAYVKMHHAAIDGGAGVAALETIFGFSPDPAPVSPPPPRAPAAPPNILELISDSYANVFRQQRQFLEAWPDMGQAIASVARRVTTDLAAPRPIRTAPKTIFNVTLSNQRAFAVCTIPLPAARALAKAADAKINDLVMAICAGALRRYLQSRDALPAEPLIAAVPVSLRRPGDAEMNNQVTAMLCSLATDVADPLERLDAIKASAQDAKDRLGDVRGAIPTDVSWLGAPIVLTGLARAMGQGLAEAMPAMTNVLISNVPGPRTPMYCAGARMIAYYPVSIPAHGGVLNITVHSYVDRMDFGLIACRAAVPDIDRLADDLLDAFRELEEAMAAKTAATDART